MRVSRNIILVGISLSILLIALILWATLRHTAVPVATPPAVTHDNDLLRVQTGSALSKRLVIEAALSTNLPHQVALPAQIIPTPGHNVTIYSPVIGRVANIHVQTGQLVQKGDILATIYSGDLAQAWSDARKAEATLEFANQAYNRAVRVLAAGGNAVKDMQSARNDLEQARAEERRAQLRLQALGTNGEEGYQPLIAPVTGVVGSISIGVGQNVSDMTSPLMSVTNLDDVWVQTSVPEGLIPTLGSSMTLSAPFPGQTCEGPVTSQDPIVHTDTRRLNIYLRCTNSQGLLHPGQFTTATLNIAERTQVLLPKTALLMDNDQVSVFVETAPNSYRRRFITVSYEEGDAVRVLSGLTAGERIITHGAILLNDY